MPITDVEQVLTTGLAAKSIGVTRARSSQTLPVGGWRRGFLEVLGTAQIRGQGSRDNGASADSDGTER